MYTPIQEYIQKSREERRSHLDLATPCINIGGSGSSEFKGLLAHFLKTEIPTKIRSIYLCHACHNSTCSNPEHLYWGTPKDNHIDQVENGTWVNPYDRIVAKLGIEKAKAICANQDHSKRKPIKKEYSEEELQKILDAFFSVNIHERGWVKAVSGKLGVSHTHVRRLYQQFFQNKCTLS